MTGARSNTVRTTTAPRGGARNGFSLLELLVVVSIIGILAAAALPRFAAFRAVAYDSRAQQDLRNLAAAQELFRATSDSYAGGVDELAGFTASGGVVIEITATDEASFDATAEHPGGRSTHRWSSNAQPALTSTPR